MKRKPPITLPGLIKALGPAALARELGVNESLPCHWSKGAHPKRTNAIALVALADKHGYTLTLDSILGASK